MKVWWKKIGLLHAAFMTVGTIGLVTALARSNCAMASVDGTCVGRWLHLEDEFTLWWLALAITTMVVSFHNSFRSVLHERAGVLQAAACIFAGAAVALTSAPAVLLAVNVALGRFGSQLFSGEQGWGLWNLWLWSASALGVASVAFLFGLTLLSTLRKG